MTLEQAEQIERLRAALDREIEEAKARHSRDLKTFQYQLDAKIAVMQEKHARERQASAALMESTLGLGRLMSAGLAAANGTAVLILLAFFAAAAVNGSAAGSAAGALTPVIGLFLFGVAAAVVTAALTYLGSGLFAEPPRPEGVRPRGFKANRAALLLTVGLSLLAFVIGCLRTFEALVPLLAQH